MRRIVAEAVREAFGAKFREVAGTLLYRRNCCQRCLTLAIAEAFIEAKKEGFILFDGATSRSAKLVLLQRLLGLREIIVCIYGVIAEKFPYVAVNVVRARSRNDVC